MEKIVGQEDIDTLPVALRGDAARVASASNAKRYDFGRAGQISTEQLRSIAAVNDLFARNLMHTVGAWLRSDFQVTLQRGEQMPYSDALHRMADHAIISSLRLEPLGAIGLVELEYHLISPIVDLLLGGTGKAEPARRLTEIEELIMSSVIDLLINELNVAWQPMGLQFAFEKYETISRIARLMPFGENTLTVSFDVQMAEARGMVTMCLPAVVLNRILRKLADDNNRPRQRPDIIRRRIREIAGQVGMTSSLQFPPIRLSAREIAQLSPGIVLRLPVPRHAPAELRVGGIAIGRARPVKMGEHRGACMEAYESAREKLGATA